MNVREYMVFHRGPEEASNNFQNACNKHHIYVKVNQRDQESAKSDD